MKNLRKLVPKEEIDALFKEVYSFSSEEEKQKNEVNLPVKRKDLNILSYKIKKFLKKNFLSFLPLDISVTDISVKEKISRDKPLFSVGYDIEGKYRFFIYTDEEYFKILEDILRIKSPESVDKNSVHSFTERIFDSTINEILTDLPLERRKLVTSSPSLYEEENIHLMYTLQIEEKKTYICVSFDEFLLDILDIKPIIYFPPTTLGKKRLEELKRYISVNIILETEPVLIPVSKLINKDEIKIKSLKIRKKKNF